MSAPPPLQYVPPPGPSLNAGLYTGQPFQPDAPWRNYPVAPDAGYYNFTNLSTVPTALPLAQHMVPGGGLRPGNNTPLLPQYLTNSRINPLNAICLPDVSTKLESGTPQVQDADLARGYSGGFAYL